MINNEADNEGEKLHDFYVKLKSFLLKNNVHCTINNYHIPNMINQCMVNILQNSSMMQKHAHEISNLFKEYFLILENQKNP